jgi:hypothetical protein
VITVFGLNPKILLKKSRFLALALLEPRDSEIVLYIFLAMSQALRERQLYFPSP